jgi:hypothetical protein
MATKNVNNFHQIVDGDMTNDIASPSTNTLRSDNVSIHLSFTGNAVGVFRAEGSNDNVNWEPLDFGAPILASGAPDNHLLSLPMYSLSFIRTIYDSTSGVGVLNSRIVTKEL